MNSERKKTFDAVKMMREIRDKISKETMDMNFEELKKLNPRRSLCFSTPPNRINKKFTPLSIFPLLSSSYCHVE